MNTTTVPDLYTGWLLIAFVDELEHEVTPVTVGGRSLLVARREYGICIADAACPHRGAHLGFGGTLLDGGIRCPFHGRLIRLGGSDDGWCVRTYRTLVLDDLVFVLLDDSQDRGFTALLERLRATHRFLSGFVVPSRVAPELVIENAFDNDHFESVHNVSRPPGLQVRVDADTLVSEGQLTVRRPNQWQGGATVTRFAARAVSPMLVVTEMGDGVESYVVLTSATPVAGGCVIRVAAGAPPHVPESALHALLADSQTAFEQDLAVWQHLVVDAPERLDVRDRAVEEYRRFCAAFAQGGEEPP